MNLILSARAGRTRILLLYFASLASPMYRSNAGTASAGAGGTPKSSEFVGSETCRGCHEDAARRWSATAMGRAALREAKTTSAEKFGCESCHGAGKTHVDGGGDVHAIMRFGKKSEVSITDQNAACLKCHEKGKRMFWRGSPHESRGMGCVDCHEVMVPKHNSISAINRFKAPLTEVTATRKTEPELCLECHQMRRAQLMRSSHMPFREGKVTCTSCHNPHGSPNPKQLIQATVNQNCYSCHAERRGPFLWEHPPVVENCATCHEAHGSTNPQLLKVRTPKLCQECHNDGQHRSTAYASVMPAAGNRTPAGFNNRVLNRGCTNCHSRLHGSNHPSGNYFTR